MCRPAPTFICCNTSCAPQAMAWSSHSTCARTNGLHSTHALWQNKRIGYSIPPNQIQLIHEQGVIGATPPWPGCFLWDHAPGLGSSCSLLLQPYDWDASETPGNWDVCARSTLDTCTSVCGSWARARSRTSRCSCSSPSGTACTSVRRASSPRSLPLHLCLPLHLPLHLPPPVGYESRVESRV